MTREQAINYLFSCGFTQEQVCDVVRALTYESTTKNDLGVDAISRADARKAIIDHQYSDNFCEEHNIDHSINTSVALLVLADLPSVTPQEPKTGYWYIDERPESNREVTCSNCDQPIFKYHRLDFDYRPKYCPNCGARMVEPQESEETDG